MSTSLISLRPFTSLANLLPICQVAIYVKNNYSYLLKKIVYGMLLEGLSLI